MRPPEVEEIMAGKNAPSINELAETYGPAAAELEITMESKLYDYLANG